MEYRTFGKAGEKTSLLGMGNMRLPTLGGRHDAIDYEKGEAIIDYVYSHGVNYFDSAYVYHGGQSEVFLGYALGKYPRESFNIVTKMPGGGWKTREEAAMIFDEQLRRCKVDYFDFYLCHNVNERSIGTFLGHGIVELLEEKQREGKIRYLGFSSHGKPETLARFAGLRKWDFAQIQLNYFDWDFQDAERQYEILTGLGIPVMVMEPVRGGRLASLCPEADALLKAARPDDSIASWAIRFAASLPNVQVVLSGMTELGHAVDNVRTMERFEPVTPDELRLLERAVDIFKQKTMVPCTGCRYCTADCPAALDIPLFMEVYNAYALAKSPMQLMELAALKDEEKPYNCLKCGHCASVCPQGIEVPGLLAELAEAMAGMPPPPPGM